MKFSYAWLRELVPGLTTTAAELQQLITMKTAECEGVVQIEGRDDLSPDWIIEIDNKSLTHRPDLWGHYGMAREVAAITGESLRDPVDLSFLPSGAAEFSVEIADSVLCPRYSALVFDHATVAPSPPWLSFRLEAIGLNAISNLVDITNFVLAELPQPMHAFDADKLSGKVIYVRPARRGERLHALNGERYELSESDLVIADGQGPIAMAGVIGGAETAVSPTTTRIVLESANFQAAGVRFTSVRHKLRTDASIRFEKSLDAENTLRGLARASQLLSSLSPGISAAGGIIDSYTRRPTPAPIELPVDYVARKLGTPVREDYVVQILTALGFGVDRKTAGTLSISIPTWRATKDISGKDDLVEEVGRMIGYGEIEPAAPRVDSVVPPANPLRSFSRVLRRKLADQGFTEVYNYSFQNEADTKPFDLDINSHLQVLNPIASELTHLRRSLLPSLLKNVTLNARNFPEFRLFEIGNEIHAAKGADAPDEVPRLAALLYNSQGDERDFFEMKRVAECLFPSAQARAAEARPYEHPYRVAVLSWAQTEIGRLFELHPSLLAEQGVTGRVVIFEINLRFALEVASAKQTKYTPLRRYPTSGFDLSLVAESKAPVGELQSLLMSAAGSHLAGIEFVRQYEGSPLPAGKKSVSFHIDIGALDHTLSSEETTSVREGIVAGMKSLGFEIRGLDG